MTDEILLREMAEEDLPVFFEQQLDPTAIYMAAFTTKDPTDREAYMARWTKLLGDNTIIKKTVLFQGIIIGQIASFELSGQREVTYWFGKEYWGRGFATQTLRKFISSVELRRPLFGRAAKDNIASRRVLEKCGFIFVDEEKGFAHARGEEIEEVCFELK